MRTRGHACKRVNLGAIDNMPRACGYAGAHAIPRDRRDVIIIIKYGE